MTNKLFITDIKSAGDIAHERIVARASEAINVGDYILFSAVANNQGVYAGQGIGFWLPNVQISPGDTLVIYTKKGEKVKTKELDGGRKSYFIYLNYPSPLWNHPDRAAVLFCVGPDWSKYRVGGFSNEADTEPS